MWSSISRGLIDTPTNLILIIGLIVFLILLVVIPAAIRYLHRPKDNPDTTRQRDPHNFYRDQFDFEDTIQEKRNGKEYDY